MQIKKGELLLVKHSRSGTWKGVASEDFDTEKDEWYSIKLAQPSVQGLSTEWEEGEEMPARRGLCKIEKLQGDSLTKKDV